jgi:peptidyl-prolyl cis-trans isomerase D
MFDAVRNNKRIVQVFLVLITLPFAFWGVESYFGSGGATGELASVGGSKIPGRNLHRPCATSRSACAGNSGVSSIRPCSRRRKHAQAMLDSLLTQRLLLLHAGKSNLMASDAQLRRGDRLRFRHCRRTASSRWQRYEQALRAQGLTQAGFEAKLRQDLTLQQLVQAVSDTAVVPVRAAERMVAIQLEERQVSEAAVRPEQFAGQVKVAAEALKDFYEKNRKQFEIPQQIRAEYWCFPRCLANVSRKVKRL